MHVQTKRKTFGSKLLSMFLATALLVTIFMPMPLAAQAAPIPAPTPVDRYSVVDGRILPASLAGDSSDWVELARSGGYSLIVRKVVLPLGQVAFDSRNISAYNISDVRNMVNNWFKNTLNKSARLRNFTVTSNAVDMKVAGSLGYFANISAGYSTPTGIKASTGDDIAFLLSFSEAAMFCSRQYATTTTTYTTSPALAVKNFVKLTPPGPEVHMKDFWWLRSEGHLAGSTKNACSVGTHATPMTGCVYASSSQAAYPYVRPALWVNSGIFQTWGTINVIGVDADNPDVELYSYTLNEYPEGPYGPIGPNDVRFFLPGVLDPDSDPISGTLWGGDVIDIKYLHTRGTATFTVIHYDLWNIREIHRETKPVPAGPYGPIEPWDLPDYDPPIVLEGSAPLIGEIDIDEHLYVIFGYGRAVYTVTIWHEAVGFGIFWVDEFDLPLGPYGPYEPLDVPGFGPGYWDDYSDPVEGECWIAGTKLYIRFFYEVL